LGGVANGVLPSHSARNGDGEVVVGRHEVVVGRQIVTARRLHFCVPYTTAKPQWRI
jgi:hypothetical protein